MRLATRTGVLTGLFSSLALFGLFATAYANRIDANKLIKKQVAQAHAKRINLKNKIIFGRDKDVYAINPDGSGETCLINKLHSYGVFNDISRDGSRILYANQGNVFLFDINGRKLKQFQVGGQTKARFSPDGKKAICSVVVTGHVDTLGRLYILDLKTGRVSPALEGISFYNQPFWNFDGNSLTFSGSEKEPSNVFDEFSDVYDATEIYTVNLDGTNRTQLTKNEYRDAEPSFSPDGKKIAFVRHFRMAINNMPIAISDIHIINSNGTEEIRVTHNIAWTTSGLGGDRLYNMTLTAQTPVFSPDGKQIVFTQGGSVNILDIKSGNYSVRRLSPGMARRWM